MNKNKTLEETTKNQNKKLIINMVEKEKPETVKQLIDLIIQRYKLTKEQTTNLIIELEKQGKLQLTKKETPLPTIRKYLFSVEAAWYWIIITLSIAATVTVFAIPENNYPQVYLRYALGAILVLFLPGYSIMKALFPSRVPISTSSETMDTIERAALSIATSLILVPIVGLILNYTSWGIRLTPVTLNLLVLTMTLATVAIIREYQTKST